MTVKKITRNSFTAEEKQHALKLGYCEIQFLLRGYERSGINSTNYLGWNYDVYMIENHIITTGYRNMIGNRPAVNPADYEEQARRVWFNYSLTYEEQLTRSHELMSAWLKACDAKREA